MGMGEEKRTLLLVNLASIMEKADEALLPAVYKEVGAALHTSPIGLGSLTLFRSFVQAACYPLAAYMALRYNRTHVIALGAFLWAAATFLVAVSDTFAQVAVARALNGVGLALVTPAIQSLVADSTDDTTRGTAFGWLQLTSNLGSLSGGLFALILASSTFMGIDGWRVAFHFVAIVSVLVGILVRLFAKDPHFLTNEGSTPNHVSRKSAWTELKELVLEAKAVVKIPSFQIIVAQGVTGSFPWSALAFAPMWLELTGFSHQETAVLMTIFAISCSVGSLLGGKMGDYFSIKYPNAGRIVLAQISSGSAVPLAALLLLALPDDSNTGFSHGFIMFIMGLSITWNAPATNNPIFAEIVPEKSRTSVYALDRSFESVLASFATPVVGYLAEHIYGYKPIKDGMAEDIITDRENAVSLAKALYTAISIPMVLCCVIYFFLYKTYPRDRERAKMDSLIASELEHIESAGKDKLDLYSKERSVIDIDYGDDDLFDGEEDEKMFVPYQVEPSKLK
ncbi:Major facilitator superfamily protein [Rhynchospora pubera]|uniref:Major facilitator superfamily protein n=1 Tax=Rhynchospora pubera TaxID=906938 RepID=A0AAV8CXN1_9POAL|nr:Major facilitator superfamily protein [Rhynchospora pubera]